MYVEININIPALRNWRKLILTISTEFYSVWVRFFYFELAYLKNSSIPKLDSDTTRDEIIPNIVFTFYDAFVCANDNPNWIPQPIKSNPKPNKLNFVFLLIA
jgi:hypothetical protein